MVVKPARWTMARRETFIARLAESGNVTAAAKALGVTRAALSNLLNGKSSLTPEMALRFEKAFSIDMETLVKMQVSFDIAQTREKQGSIQVTRYRKSNE